MTSPDQWREAAPVTRDRSLLRHHDFRQLWAAETVSQVGTQVTLLALPVLAVSLLEATPLEMGVLTALETAAFLLIGLPAGAWVDRWRRRRVLVTADLVRAAVLATLPVAYLLDVLTLGQLFVVAAATGTATVFFDVAYQSYLPALVDRDQLVDGNGKLEASRAVAQVAGPGITGVLLRVLSAPMVIALDAASFLLSAFFLSRVERPDAVPDRAGRRPLRTEIAEGLSFVVRQPLLRRIVACTGTSNLFSTITTTLLVLYALRRLELSESVLGLVFSAGAVGGLVGAATAARFARTVGEGRAIPLAVMVMVPFTALTPLAATGAPLILLPLGQFGFSWAVVVYNITQVSFRQRLCPPALLGRMNASVRFLVFGTMPLGGLLGGVLGTWLGVLPTLWIAAAGQLLAAGWVVASPLLRMRDLPDGPDAPAGGVTTVPEARAPTAGNDPERSG
ncbi:MFS transporter [Modestobacter caceresii]|uniref:MFS transporter n=1 Tax=Modestobacter caceresii TaxID=1522368 RepID=A0A098YBT3_9ACTN|nr:MFS transporter [Modestobacter caceresii]